jgi:hypothetical protein
MLINWIVIPVPGRRQVGETGESGQLEEAREAGESGETREAKEAREAGDRSGFSAKMRWCLFMSFQENGII